MKYEGKQIYIFIFLSQPWTIFYINIHEQQVFLLQKYIWLAINQVLLEQTTAVRRMSHCHLLMLRQGN
jgi:hypothetical protein